MDEDKLHVNEFRYLARVVAHTNNHFFHFLQIYMPQCFKKTKGLEIINMTILRHHTKKKLNFKNEYNN